MNEQLWSWLLGVVGIGGFILAGKKVWWAWYINIAAQVLWITYGITTSKPGFVVSALVYTVVFAKNAITWTKEHFASDAEKWWASIPVRKNAPLPAVDWPKTEEGTDDATIYALYASGRLQCLNGGPRSAACWTVAACGCQIIIPQIKADIVKFGDEGLIRITQGVIAANPNAVDGVLMFLKTQAKDHSLQYEMCVYDEFSTSNEVAISWITKPIEELD